MFASRELGFSFVHIPKNAGSSIKHPARDFDDFDGRYYHRQSFEGEEGIFHNGHIPLDLLAKHRPDDLALLRSLPCYAIIRDPADRFVSAFSQYLRSPPLKLQPETATDAEINSAFDAIEEHLATKAFPHDRFIVFARQSLFTDLAGERMVDHLVPFEKTDQLYGVLRESYGLPIRDGSVYNPTVTYRSNRLVEPLRKMKKWGQRFLPRGLYEVARDTAAAALTVKGAERFSGRILDDPRTDSLVREYYAGDQALYREAKARWAAAMGVEEVNRTA